MSILEVAGVHHTIYEVKKYGDEAEAPRLFQTVEDIINVQAIYRLMNSLERRGLVGRLLHRRPARWYYVIWKDGTPTFGEDSDYIHVMERLGKVQFRTNGEVWEIGGSLSAS